MKILQREKEYYRWNVTKSVQITTEKNQRVKKKEGRRQIGKQWLIENETKSVQITVEINSSQREIIEINNEIKRSQRKKQ